MPSPNPGFIRIWDLPTRLFHWLLVISVTGAFVTIKLGGWWTEYHFLFGYATLSLVAFRLVWGVIGPEHARFARFIRGPRALWASLRGQGASCAGHTPLGALSVVAMLLVLGTQAVLGLFASDGIFSEGPLAHLVSADLSDQLTGLHHSNENIILALIALHLLAVTAYVVIGRKRLVRPMLSGDKRVSDVPAGTRASDDGIGMRLRAAVLAALAIGLFFLLVSMGQ